MEDRNVSAFTRTLFVVTKTKEIISSSTPVAEHCSEQKPRTSKETSTPTKCNISFIFAVFIH